MNSKMNSKEAVKELYKEREYLLGDKVHSKSETWHNDITHYDNINHCLLTIDKDLDRLEELEKENEVLKKELERLETLKNIIETDHIVILEGDKNYRAINEWLEND